MNYRAICVAVLLSSLSAVGCGTVANQVQPRYNADGKDPFGGVKHDVASIHEASNGTATDAGAEQWKQAAKAICCAVDLPFSAIGDTLLWPYTTAYNFINAPVPVPPIAVQETNPSTPATLAPMPAERLPSAYPQLLREPMKAPAGDAKPADEPKK
jgi:uncharacterized protein YceK